MEVRDGQPHFVQRDLEGLTLFTAPQAQPKTDRDLQLVRAKIIPVRKRGYIAGEKADSIMYYFYVPKGLDDVRIVYNGTGCRLNDVI